MLEVSPVMTSSKLRSRVSPVTALGTLLLIAVIGQAVFDSDSLVVNVFELAIPVVLGFAIIYIDRWMYREGFDDDELTRSFSYAIYGLLALAGLATWLTVLQRMNGTRLGEPSFVVLGAATVGAAAGLILGVSRIRQRRAMESIDQQREQLESFASTVSHDLRNPLNVALAKLDEAGNEVDHPQLDHSISTLQRMDEILEGTLELARQGSIVRDPEPVDLNAVIEQAWADTDTGGATLSVGDALGTVAGDEARLYQLFENLFQNAVEHAGSAVTVRVGTFNRGIFIEDDGPGIPEGIRDRVVERGFSARPDGSGLGLSIVQAIAMAHGWNVRVTNSENGGTRIELRDLN